MTFWSIFGLFTLGLYLYWIIIFLSFSIQIIEIQFCHMIHQNMCFIIDNLDSVPMRTESAT